MIRHVTLALVAALAAMPAVAQTVDTDSSSNSQSTSGAQTATNVNNALTIQTEQHRDTSVKTAPGHGLAAATNSFSSDYCGGTAQVGASGMGWSIGGSKQAYDTNCQALRRVDKFGQLSREAYNQGYAAEASKAYSMAVWTACTIDAETQKRCEALGMVVPLN